MAWHDFKGRYTSPPTTPLHWIHKILPHNKASLDKERIGDGKKSKEADPTVSGSGSLLGGGGRPSSPKNSFPVTGLYPCSRPSSLARIFPERANLARDLSSTLA